MITTLTKSQTKMIDTVQQEWLDMMFSCKLRTNRKEATKYINWLYKFCGYTKPIIIFLSSPLATQIGANALVNVLSKYDWSKVKKEQIRSQIGSQIGSQIRSQKLKYYNWSWEGSIYYWNYYSYLQYYQKAKLLPKELFKNFNNLVTLCKSGVYDMIQLDGLCVVSDMPTFISRDERHRLHNTKGPAIKFADGFELNFIQGGAFNDKKLFKGIVKGTLSAEYILTKIENTEQRRIAWELMDKAKIKKLKNLKVLDEQVDGKGKKMKIFTFTVKGFNIPFYIYEGIDASTNRYYHLETDKKDCWSAKAGFVGLKADEVIYIEEY